MKYCGTLFGWLETGTEGAVWALEEFGKIPLRGELVKK